MNVRMPNPNLHTIDPPKQHLPESRNVMWNNKVTLADFQSAVNLNGGNPT